MINDIVINAEITAEEIDTLLEEVKRRRDIALVSPCPTEIVLATCHNFANYIQENIEWIANIGEYYSLTTSDLSSLSKEILQFCQRDYLTEKLNREFKTTSPFTIRRPHLKNNIFEGWQALGAVLHITPANTLSLPFMAAVEGLLAGNFNIVRTSHKDLGVSITLLNKLISLDTSGILAKYIITIQGLSKALLPALIQLVDGVSAWGGDSSLSALRNLIPVGCRFITWGHKLSFVYLADQSYCLEKFNAIAKDICEFNQQACSSPQLILVNTSNWDKLVEVGQIMAEAMSNTTNQYAVLTPSPQETAEITTQMHLAELESALGEQQIKIWESVDGSWRIIVTDKAVMQPSPLFRTILINPAPIETLVRLLQPYRHWLQTCALIAKSENYPSTAQTLLSAGITRITSPGAMHQEYPGEPHDGLYALPQLARRVSINPQSAWKNSQANLQVTPFNPPSNWKELPIMQKADFIKKGYDSSRSELFFQSGGTSGKPKLATFSYADYHLQMQTAADGLLAAGLNPNKDCVMNLLYAGNLYAGFHSFSTVLDKLGVQQFPMGGPTLEDLPFVAQTLVDQEVNTIIGMPSTIFLLFSQQKEILNAYRGIKKIFYGGEFMGVGQRKLFEEMGVELIKSAMYGSVDAGILGYACSHSTEGSFHLITTTQHLEIIQIGTDLPVEKNQTGRLIFSSNRESQPLPRYEIGDIGRWINEPCPCGSTEPKFELLGRMGDVVKVGTYLIDCKRIKTWIEQHGNYQDILQIRLDYNDAQQERMSVCFNSEPQLTVSEIKTGLATYYIELGDSIKSKLLDFQVEYHIPLTQNQHSGKFPLIIDLRPTFIEEHIC